MLIDSNIFSIFNYNNSLIIKNDLDFYIEWIEIEEWQLP